MKLYKTTNGILLQNNNDVYLLQAEWDTLVNRKNLFGYLQQLAATTETITITEFTDMVQQNILAPIGSQEVWAAGVTYMRSREARMEESKAAGGGDFYDRVYYAERPEIFFKSLPQRVVGNEDTVNIRRDSTWDVPEPELTLFINSYGDIQGYTVGNDMSSRSIEGENPLYLPQAKSYERSTALGPCLYVPAEPISKDTTISIVIRRSGEEMFKDEIQLNRMKRELPELAGYLFRELDFPQGCYLMTGTGMVPPNSFTLQPGDVVAITIEGIGTLTNTVAKKN